MGRCFRGGCWVLLVLSLRPPLVPWAQAQDPPPPPPEDEAVLNDFAAALDRFRALSVDEFEAHYGPSKRYLEHAAGKFTRGDSNGDGLVNISDPICTLHELFFGAGSCAVPGCPDAL